MIFINIHQPFEGDEGTKFREMPKCSPVVEASALMHKVIDPIVIVRRPNLLLPWSAEKNCSQESSWFRWLHRRSVVKKRPEPWLQTWLQSSLGCGGHAISTDPDWSCWDLLRSQSYLEMQNMLSRLEDVLFERQSSAFFCSCSEIKTGLQVAAVENEVWVHRSPKLVFAKSVRLRLFRMLHFNRKMLCPAGQNCNEKGSILLQWRFGHTDLVHIWFHSKPSPERGVSLQPRVGRMNLQMGRIPLWDDLMQVVDSPTPAKY